MPVSDSHNEGRRLEGVRKARWKRILLWTVVGLVVVILATGSGFYLWFRSEVKASNARTDPAVLQALQEQPTTTSTTSPTSTTTVGNTSSTSIAQTSSTTTSVSIPETPGSMNMPPTEMCTGLSPMSVMIGGSVSDKVRP